ncbi:MAG TPA: hypothetical protein VFU35_16060, partial [Jatrophihabitans sp.]|nr:hypothetical protein [Jatrophihabitans sp.]
MTATLHRPAPPRESIDAWVIGGARLLAGLCNGASLDLRAHLATHGPMPGTDLEHLLAHLDAVGGLAGRGGAGFPFAAKLRALAPGRRRVIVNGTESEPGSHKDRVLLRRAPHLVLDGALAVAGAVGARRVTVAVHDDATAARLRVALGERPDGRRVDVRVIRGGFVAGEARAVERALDGGPAVPPGRRTPGTVNGSLLS